MTSTPLLVVPPKARPARVTPLASNDAESAWRIVSVLGAAFLAIGLFDLALAWFPLALGSPEWEFGTVTRTLDGLPVPVMGAALALAAALAGGSRVTARVMAVLMLALAVIVVAIGILWATTLPFAFKPVTNDVVRLGLTKAVAKTSMQLLVYPTLFTIAAVVGWRRSAR